MKRLLQALSRLISPKKPFLADSIRIVEDLGKDGVRTRAYYKDEPVGRDVILKPTSSAGAYFNHPLR